MKRRWKITIGVVGGLLVLLILNALVVNGQTKDAHTTVPGARIVEASGGNVQVTDTGPRDGSPIVLLHCYTCSLRWFDGMLPALQKDHRVIRIDLLGHGGSEKPAAGYGMEDQAATVASVLAQLGVSDATVVGHSLGFTVATALAVQSPGLVSRLVDIDQAVDNDGSHFPFAEKLSRVPLIGQALWRTLPDWEIRNSYKVAFAPGYNLASGFEDPDQPVHDLRSMTYRSYKNTSNGEIDYTDSKPLNERLAPLGKPLLVIFGTEDQLYDATKSADAYKSVPGAQIEMVDGAGHSPNVEKPVETSGLILEFAANPNNPNAKPAKPEFTPPNKHKARARKKAGA